MTPARADGMATPVAGEGNSLLGQAPPPPEEAQAGGPHNTAGAAFSARAPVFAEAGIAPDIPVLGEWTYPALLSVIDLAILAWMVRRILK